MTVRELTTGVSGATAHEVGVAWPLFFQYQGRERDRQEKAAERKARRR